MEQLIADLKKIEKEMFEFTSPKNAQGFVRIFAHWVCQAWKENSFFDTDVIYNYYSKSFYPIKTDMMLKDSCLTYADFIKANTGNTVSSNISGMEVNCESYEDRLEQFFGDACRKQLNEMFNKYEVTLPDQYKKDYSSMLDLIFNGRLNSKVELELFKVCQSINLNFNPLGLELSHYECLIEGTDEHHNFIISDCAVFKDYSLKDFQDMAVLI